MNACYHGRCGPSPKPVFVSEATFDSPDEAVIAAVNKASTLKGFFRDEYGGVIFQSGSHFGFTVFRGRSINLDLVVRTDSVAWWHTHPGDQSSSINASNEWLTDSRFGHSSIHLGGPGVGDLQRAAAIFKVNPGAADAYLFTPSGILKYFPDPVGAPRQYQIVPFSPGGG
jgi:hypothetical protein